MSKNGCQVTKRFSQTCVIYDCDLCAYLSGLEICDFLASANGGRILAAIEMKSGGINAKKVVSQLQAGANELDKRAMPGSKEFIAALFHKGGLHALELKIFNRSTIAFRGKKVPVLLRKCGSDLSSLVAEKYRQAG